MCHDSRMGQNREADSPLVMERIDLSETGRSFDVEFWRRQGSNAIFAAAWEMVLEAHKLKNKGDAEPAFQRTVERIGPMRR
jgi:hypothetical protein